MHMIPILAGIFLILHGLVHLWYVVLAYQLVEFQPDMGWTGKSWILSSFLNEKVVRSAAGALFALAALAFVFSGIGFLANAGWARPLILLSAILSSLVILIFWDGSSKLLVQKGILGFLINVVILLVLAFS